MRAFILCVTISSILSSTASISSDEDSIVIEVPPNYTEEKIMPLRSERQFVSVTGIGQYPGFPPGWPFGIHQPPAHIEQIPQKPKRPSPPQRPTTPPPRISQTCLTTRNKLGRCRSMRECYPVLYSPYPNETTHEFMLGNPVLAETLRIEVAGPCKPRETYPYFLFTGDSKFRRDQICCPSNKEETRPSGGKLQKTTTTVRPTKVTTVKYKPNPPRKRPFGHHPPTSSLTSPTTSKPAISSSCGIPNIVGGSETKDGKYPWMVALMNGQKQFCGGSLIGSQHILTAAHCVVHMGPTEVARIRVLLGAHNIRHVSGKTVVRKVIRLVRHRLFSHQTLHNDVAVLKLDSPVKFSHYISPICLARGQNRFANKKAVVAGWGSLGEHSGQPATLREVTINIWTNERCRAKYGHLAPGGITEHMMCAGSPTRDACRGDSGGPLMHHNGNFYEQIGIVSWGIGCGRFPGVYSRVTDFLGWITKNSQ